MAIYVLLDTIQAASGSLNGNTRQVRSGPRNGTGRMRNPRRSRLRRPIRILDRLWFMALQFSLRLAAFGCIRLHRLVARSSGSTCNGTDFGAARLAKDTPLNYPYFAGRRSLNDDLEQRLPTTVLLTGSP